MKKRASYKFVLNGSVIKLREDVIQQIAFHGRVGVKVAILLEKYIFLSHGKSQELFINMYE